MEFSLLFYIVYSNQFSIIFSYFCNIFIFFVVQFYENLSTFARLFLISYQRSCFMIHASFYQFFAISKLNSSQHFGIVFIVFNILLAIIGTGLNTMFLHHCTVIVCILIIIKVIYCHIISSKALSLYSNDFLQ